MTRSAKFRVGLVGAGYVSEFHIRALKRLPEVHITGITDLNQDRARAACERFGIASYPSLDAMAAAGLDVVHVLTPPANHVAVALSALRLHCHVLVEKPLATTVEECDRLATESALQGREVCVNHSMLADPVFVKTVDAVRNGAVGDVLTVDVFRSSVYPPYHGGALPPQYGDGGYPFRDLGVHALYMLRELLGPVENVQAEFASAGQLSSDPNLYFDEWRALVRCAHGSGQIQLSWSVRPLQHIVIVQGTRGTLRADLFSMFVTHRRNLPVPKAIERVVNAAAESAQSAFGVGTGVARFVMRRAMAYQGLHDFVREFYRCLAAGAPMPASIDSARDIVHWTEQVARSADSAKVAGRPRRVTPSEPAIVVTGANGTLGRALVLRLLKDGQRVRLFVRREPPADIRQFKRLEVVFGELGDPSDVERALANATSVLHCGAAMFGPWPAHASGTIEGTRNVVSACLAHKIEKLVYVSSLSVLHATEHAGTTVTESAALELHPEERGSYSRAKLEAERIVRAAMDENGLRAVILRPGHIWSADGPLLSPAVGMLMGRWLVMLGDRALLLPMVNVEDVVTAVLLAMNADKILSGEVFHIVDDDPISREELARLLAARDSKMRIVHLPIAAAIAPASIVSTLTGLLGHRLGPSPYRLRSGVTSLRFDCTKARCELGWLPAVKSRIALRAILDPDSQTVAHPNRE